MTLLRLAFKSFSFRKSTILLSIFSIALSVSLLVGVERLKEASRESFTSTVSGVNLIVGARSGTIPLMLYTVFQIGNPTNNVSWQAYQNFSNKKEVKWSIPISLGDSHKAYRVIATNDNFFQHYQFGKDKGLEFYKGEGLNSLFNVVIGYQVYEKESYKIGQDIVLAHGIGSQGIQEHDNLPFKVTGILKPTGTPIDRSVLISLEAMEAIHYDWKSGVAPAKEEASTKEDFIGRELKPEVITAFFVKLDSLLGVFDFQDQIRNYEKEAMSAVMPGVALQDLWKILSGVEKMLLLLSIAVFLVSLISVYLALQSSMKERMRELAILRSLGATPVFVFSLLILDGVIQAVIGISLGLIILFGVLSFYAQELASRFALYKGLMELGLQDGLFIVMIFIGVILAALVPVWWTFSKSLGQGLVVRN